MIMPTSSDRLQCGLCPQTRLSLAWVETVDSARTLDQRHHSGPTAALVLAEALSAVALLGGDTLRAGETVRFEMSVNGPVRGLCVECSGEGMLRGFTECKRLPDLDAREELDTREALGDQALGVVRRFRAGHAVEETNLSTQPALPETVLAHYIHQSAQQPAVVILTALAYGAYLELSRGLVILPLPGCPNNRLADLTRMQENGLLLEALESAPSLAPLCAALDLADIRLAPSHPLRFGCVCTDSHVGAVLGGLSDDAFQSLRSTPSPGPVICRMCGAKYAVSPLQLDAESMRRVQSGGAA